MASNAMDPSGLAELWEKDQVIRTRVLEGRIIHFPKTQDWCQATRENAKGNSCILMPILEKLSVTPNYHLPHLQGLQAEFTKLHEALGKVPDAAVVYRNSVEVKKLCGFIKRRVNHKEVTKDIGLKTLFVYSGNLGLWLVSNLINSLCLLARSS